MKKPKDENDKIYITITEAQRLTGYSRRQIDNALRTNRVHSIKEANSRIKVNLPQLLQYQALLQSKEPDPIWGCLSPENGKRLYPLYGFDCMYCYTDSQQVINLSSGKVEQIYTSSDDHLFVTLRRNSKNTTVYIHRLEATYKCPNALNKLICHHINGNPADNRPANLIWVTVEEHIRLHQLMKQKRKKEYHAMIKAIKKENSQKLYTIPSSDYESDDKFDYFMMVNVAGYRAHKKSIDIPLESIKMEFARLRENNKKRID